MTLGLYLRGKREERGLTQTELARAVAVSKQFLCDVEQERRSMSQEVIDLLAQKLEVCSDYLYYLRGRIPPDIREMNLCEKEVKRLFMKLRGAKQ